MRESRCPRVAGCPPGCTHDTSGSKLTEDGGARHRRGWRDGDCDTLVRDGGPRSRGRDDPRPPLELPLRGSRADLRGGPPVWARGGPALASGRGEAVAVRALRRRDPSLHHGHSDGVLRVRRGRQRGPDGARRPVAPARGSARAAGAGHGALRPPGEAARRGALQADRGPDQSSERGPDDPAR